MLEAGCRPESWAGVIGEMPTSDAAAGAIEAALSLISKPVAGHRHVVTR